MVDCVVGSLSYVGKESIRWSAVMLFYFQSWVFLYNTQPEKSIINRKYDTFFVHESLPLLLL